MRALTIRNGLDHNSPVYEDSVCKMLCNTNIYWVLVPHVAYSCHCLRWIAGDGQLRKLKIKFNWSQQRSTYFVGYTTNSRMVPMVSKVRSCSLVAVGAIFVTTAKSVTLPKPILVIYNKILGKKVVCFRINLTLF